MRAFSREWISSDKVQNIYLYYLRFVFTSVTCELESRRPMHPVVVLATVPSLTLKH